MADLAALAEAESLLDFATDLTQRIDAEVRDAEATRRMAQESLERVLAAGKIGGEHAGFLGGELRQGLRRQEAALAALAGGAEAGRAFWEVSLPGLTALPALATSAHIPRTGSRMFVPDPPRVTAPTADELRRTPLPDLYNSGVWDLFAQEVSTFQDVFEKALAELDQADAALEQPEVRRERGRKKAPAGQEKDRRHS